MGSDDVETVGNGVDLKIDMLVPCLFQDPVSGPQHRTARILEKRPDRKGNMEFYVHYTEFNRRFDEWVPISRFDLAKIEALQSAPDDTQKMTRQQKRKHDEAMHEEGHEGLDQKSIEEHNEVTKLKFIEDVFVGGLPMRTWYYSPLPPEYRYQSQLHFCPFCLKFVKTKKQLMRHVQKRVCPRHPPGDEIYRKDNISMFEVDGAKRKIFCQNLCFFAKLFLDHKLLFYDVDAFLFYVMCVYTEHGYDLVGYFSKEKVSDNHYNLACILTLPCYQKKGYGQFLINFSYELSKKEKKVGTPERPLSDLGVATYRRYWTRVLVDVLRKYKGEEGLSIKDLESMTKIWEDDIKQTLEKVNLLRYYKGQYVICIPPKLIEEHLKGAEKEKKRGPQVDPSKLFWTPHTHAN